MKKQNKLKKNITAFILLFNHKTKKEFMKKDLELYIRDFIEKTTPLAQDCLIEFVILDKILTPMSSINIHKNDYITLENILEMNLEPITHQINLLSKKHYALKKLFPLLNKLKKEIYSFCHKSTSSVFKESDLTLDTIESFILTIFKDNKIENKINIVQKVDKSIVAKILKKHSQMFFINLNKEDIEKIITNDDN